MSKHFSRHPKAGLHRIMGVIAVGCFLALIPTAHPADFALKLDGTNDLVTFGPAPGLGASNFTLEVWFIRQGNGISTNTGTGGITAFPLLTKGRAEADGDNRDMNYFLGISSNNFLTADFERFAGGANQPVPGITPILSNVWYHAAVTYDGTNWAMYLNGSLETNVFVGTNVFPRYDSIQHAALGTTINSLGATGGFFAGTLDEPRIWNYARSQQAIRDTIRTAVTNAPGLLGRWGLDAGSGTIATNSVNPATLSGILSNGPVYVAGVPFEMTGVGGLLFDGVDDYVTFGPTNALGLATFTIETWFKRTGTGKPTTTGAGGIAAAIPLVTKGRGESDGSNVDMNYFLGITTNDNKLCADFEQFTNGTNWPVAGQTAITNGGWYHAAVTYDGTNWAMYLNGSLETNVFVGAGVLPRYDSIQHAGLGSAMTSVGAPQGFFQGVMDEVRIWDHARTASEIQSSMNLTIPSASGLVAHWGLDEGSGVVVSNTGSSAIHGVLTNAPVPWWATGVPLAPAGVGGLFLDGNNDYVTFGPTNALGLATFTIETWFECLGTGKAASTGAGGLIAVPLVTKGRNEVDGSDVDMNYFFGITTNGNKLCADFESLSTGTNWPVVGVTTITNGGWYHAAATYDGASWSLYLNGVLETNVFVGETPRYDSIQHAALGAALNSSGVPNGAFLGILDEVRIWNYARSAEQIASNQNYVIPSAAGLVAHWGLDEGSGLVASNSGSSGVDGVLTNGPTWSAGYALTTNAPPSVTITNPVDAAVFNEPANILIEATASDDGTVTNVAFYAGNTFIGEDFTSPFNVTWSGVTAGSYALKAVATDNAGLTATSTVVNITVVSLPVGVTNTTPACGSATGGTAVTVTGSNFLSGAAVTIGGVAASNVVVVSGDTITAVTPSNAVGPAIVSVTNTNGGSGALTNGFTYVTALSFGGLVSATPATESATLSWGAGAGAVSYKVFQATTSGGQDFNAPALITNSLSAWMAPLYPGSNSPITYYFVLRATDGCGDSESNTVEQSVQPLLNPGNDQDGDGVANGFEQAYGLNPFGAADASLDADGDGMSNLQEFLAGTDPTNHASAFRIVSIVRAGNDMAVSWMTGTSRTNALQWTAGSGNGSYDPSGFADLFTVTNTSGIVTNYTDAGAATNTTHRYYRIRLVP